MVLPLIGPPRMGKH